MNRLNRSTLDLSADEIHAIRMARGSVPQRETGLKFGLSQATINKIQRGVTRRDVKFTPAELVKSALWLRAVGGRASKGVAGVPVSQVRAVRD